MQTQKMENKPMETPETLYRGVVLPASEVHSGLLTQDLAPGSGKIDDQGRKVVHDGNEYGVYMTDNPSMVKSAYGSPPDYGDDLPDSPSFKWRGVPGIKVQAPRVGITYQIDTNGLDVRKPFILDVWQSHYNNGFKGDEWISDSVPATNHEITRLKIGRDILHDPKVIEVSDDPEIAFEELRMEIDRRLGRLAVACDIIESLPASSRLNDFRIKEVLANIPG
ncbi:MAG: hypothetical protein WCK26_01625 [Candidatus Saccharibacteria bacterium]